MTGDKTELLQQDNDALKLRVAEMTAHQKDIAANSKSIEYALLNATSDLAVIISNKGIILQLSEATCARVDKQPLDLIGTCIYDYFESDEMQFRKAYISMVVQSRQLIHFEDQYDDMTLLVCIYPVVNRKDEVEKLAIYISDTTELKKNEMLLYRYSQIMATINDPIAYIDKNFIYQTVNEATLSIYKKTRDEMIDHRVEEILGKKVFEEKLKPHIIDCLKGEKIYDQDWFDFPDGQRRFMYMSYYPLFAKDKIVSGVVINAIDVTKMKKMEDELKLLSQTDQLTQVYNRVKFHDSLTKEINRVRRYKTDLALIMFDIDHFKNVNDTYGHDVGDYVLKKLATMVKDYVRETDILARWGGEEFMILLPHTNLNNASKLAERIRAKIEGTLFETVNTITSSFGVTQFVMSDDEETFTKRLDRALYKAKEKGRNRVIVARAVDTSKDERANRIHDQNPTGMLLDNKQ
ncbi:MAG: diguanylate cyclase [bacterium]|nr:diguanylate cyclase [bacterium]